MNLVSKNYRQICFGIALCCLQSVFSVHACISAKNRNDVFEVLNQLKDGLSVPGLDVWVNENMSDPFVEVGDFVYFTMKSDEPVFHTLIHVDSKGATSLFVPESGFLDDKGSDYLVFPPLNNSCVEYKNNDNCFNPANNFVQNEPVGRDTVYLLASKQPIAADSLGMAPGESFRDLGKDLSEISKVVQLVNSQTTDNPVAVVRYGYAVESDETEHKSRGLKVKIEEMEKEVMRDDSHDNQQDAQTLTFNNINFSWNSDELTVPGRVELDVLGSALVGMQETNGVFPHVELTGHTDSTGPDDVNVALSASRAESAKRYLISEHGVPAEQVSILGAGESIPVDGNDTREGRARNRRVELSIFRPQ